MSIVNTETGEITDFDRPAAERRAERISLRLDAIADNYAAVMPMIRDSIAQRDDLALGYRSPGEYVADRFGGSLQRLGIEVRRAVVGELTAAGLSTRAIAPVVGVDQKTVVRDIRAGEAHASPEPQTPASAAVPRAEAGPHSSDADAVGAPASEVLAPVRGIDGKTYTRPAPIDFDQRERETAAAVEEFPELAYFAEQGETRQVRDMAGDLRRYRDRGELEERLETLRKSIALDRSKRDGTYVAPVLAPATHCRTCTCNGDAS